MGQPAQYRAHQLNMGKFQQKSVLIVILAVQLARVLQFKTVIHVKLMEETTTILFMELPYAVRHVLMDSMPILLHFFVFSVLLSVSPAPLILLIA